MNRCAPSSPPAPQVVTTNYAQKETGGITGDLKGSYTHSKKINLSVAGTSGTKVRYEGGSDAEGG